MILRAPFFKNAHSSEPKLPETFLFLGCSAFRSLQKVHHGLFLFLKDEREEKS
jgi:hypothetical protein